ncbi:lytic polysaccharide monooxygenase auxiliary activity family 9 protein [Streptomyces aidingensis]|uniref:Chitin-binding protein n=1 Tax=Streptomyces aidingensis TaxID=910347 RepID=A0A1I1UDP0_9ACTN|nr:lytic polysaccharide monooxygenase auxiliary activity family 9 protein [Streptomyces aidingensis]SFD66893.1 chitin-binding protein [Streptomyces aidingensis]
MSIRHRARTVAAVLLAPLAAGLVTAAPGAAHGTMDNPISRARLCFVEGPEAPRSDACRDAVALGGTQAFYDWHEVSLADAAGRHRELIPDGRLCSAGREKYAGLDQARADWPATGMSSGSHTFRYTATAPHRGGFQVYLTRPGYAPDRPPAWSDLELIGEVDDPPLAEGAYVFTLDVPQRRGRHLIYTIWQRTDSPEAFYSCSDVVFGDGGGEAAGGGGDRGSGTPGQGGATAPSGEKPEPEPEPRTEPAPEPETGPDSGDRSTAEATGRNTGPATDPRSNGTDANSPAPSGRTEAEVGTDLAATGGGSGTALPALGGAAAMAAGAAVLLASVRRRRALGRRRI